MNINQLIDKLNSERKTENLDYQPKRLFQALPLRSQIKPQYITLDTTCLINLLVTKNVNEYSRNVVKYHHKIWLDYFHLGLKCFQRSQKYVFNYMIKTDGVAASIILIRKDLKDKKSSNQPSQKDTPTEKYLDQCVITPEMQQRKIVGIDPNKRDLIYCSDELGQTFRYTTDQRRVSTRSKKYRKITENQKKITLINGKTVVELESELAHYNCKTCDYIQFCNYLKAKNYLNTVLFEFYNRSLFRKLKFNLFVNRQRSESQMINRFKKKFGPPKEVLIAFGDHQQKHQMRFHEPTKDIGLRRLFHRNGYEVYLVNEFRTSCRCYKCGKGVSPVFITLIIMRVKIWSK
jgi:hypothetical protein